MKKIQNIISKKSFQYSLEQTFEEALQNPDFKDLVSKLKVPKEELYKYTSLLEECSKEYSQCLHCKNILDCPNKVNGYAYLPKVINNKLEFRYKVCNLKKRIDKKNEHYKNMILFDVPNAIKEASFSKIYKNDKKRFDTIIWLTDFISKYEKDPYQKGLFLHGNFGCGKSYLIAATFNELAKKGFKSAIVFWPEFLNSLKRSFNSSIKSEFNTKYNQIKKVPLLLIDDIGAESVTPWSRDEILCPLLQYRMNEKLPTFLTSNLDYDALEQHLAVSKSGSEIIKSTRIIQRIKQLTEEKELISKNLRK